jgi:hypothetical protein
MPEVASLFCGASHLLPGVANNSPTKQQEACTTTTWQQALQIHNGQSRDLAPTNLVPSDPLVTEPCFLPIEASACWPGNSLVQMSLIESGET